VQRCGSARISSEESIAVARLPIVFSIAVLGFGLGIAAKARAAVELCVEARTESADGEGWKKLVLSEVGRHPSHHVVDANCQSRLRVELFRTSGSRYLTVQLDGEVPDRSTILADADVAPKLAESISQVLGNDPMHLSEDPSKWSAMERASRAMMVRGLNTYRLELFEVMARTDQNIAFAPGIGIGFARGADQWQIAASLHLAGSPAGISGSERALRLCTGMDLGVLWEASRKANTSGYLGAGAGLTVLRFAGLVDPKDKNSMTDVTAWRPVVNLRAGIRLLRIYDFDADAFLQASIPLWSTKQVDDDLWGKSGTWTPMLKVGVGLGF
jgi:hypothetical protein